MEAAPLCPHDRLAGVRPHLVRERRHQDMDADRSERGDHYLRLRLRRHQRRRLLPVGYTPTRRERLPDYDYALVGSQIRPTQEMNALPGVTCTQSGATTTAGCQTLRFTYATSTGGSGNCGTSYGDYTGQLKSVAYTAYDPQPPR